jgi:hypothetical protein
MKTVSIPDINKIISKPEARTVEGFFTGGYFQKGKFYKKQRKTQATLPEDGNLLKKVGLAKNDKVLFIAGYYGNWPKALAKAGAIVYYTDVSKNLVNYARKNLKEKRIKECFCSDFTLVPDKSLKYDWTFSFEPLGTRQGLPIAMLRSLLNRKGGKLIVYPRIVEMDRHFKSSKPYTLIAKNLSMIYKTRYEISRKAIEGKDQKNRKLTKKHVIITIYASEPARRKVELDLKTLKYIDSKKRINKKELNGSKEVVQSIKRIERLAKLIKKDFIKKVVIE